MTEISIQIRDSKEQRENQTVTIRVGDRWNRHDEEVTGVAVTNIIVHHHGVFGRCVIDGQLIPVRPTGENTWRIND